MIDILNSFNEELTLDNLEHRIQTWITKFNGSATKNENKQLNEMHVVGMKLCVDIDKLQIESYESYSLDEMYTIFDIRQKNKLLHCLSWQELVDFVTLVQLNYKKIIQYDKEYGFKMKCNLKNLYIFVLKRAGFWIGHSWKEKFENESGENVDYDLIHGTVIEDVNKSRTLSTSTISHFMDFIHTFISLSTTIQNSIFITIENANEKVQFHQNHREASIDDFYYNCMIRDIPLGSILQYSHRFQYLFHSITQVIYFHWPAYKRDVQISMEELQKLNAPSESVVPLLLQLDPDIELLNEHNSPFLIQDKISKWKWIHIAGFFILLFEDTQAYMSNDVRELFLHYQQNK